MKGYRFLRDGDKVRVGDEFRHPGRRTKWEAPGPHVIGMTYTRKFMVLTFRRPVPNSLLSTDKEVLAEAAEAVGVYFREVASRPEPAIYTYLRSLPKKQQSEKGTEA